MFRKQLTHWWFHDKYFCRDGFLFHPSFRTELPAQMWPHHWEISLICEHIRADLHVIEKWHTASVTITMYSNLFWNLNHIVALQLRERLMKIPWTKNFWQKVFFVFYFSCLFSVQVYLFMTKKVNPPTPIATANQHCLRMSWSSYICLPHSSKLEITDYQNIIHIFFGNDW